MLRYEAGARANLFAAEAADFYSHIDHVAWERTLALKAAGLEPPAPATGLSGGRLLLYCRDDNLADGAAELETDGFFDVDNVPAWDTWLCDYSAPPDNRAREHCLVAWIPPTHVQLADRGVYVNPEGCIIWVDSPDLRGDTIYTGVVRRLKERGLLEL